MPADISLLQATQVSSDQFWSIGIGLFGGLALFLYGIEKMSDGLRAVAGDGLKTLLSRLTVNRFTGVVTGAAVTAVIQSSSLTTVLIVGFVSAGLMTLQQSVGVIMGANIGTTLTVQIAAFQITKTAWLLLVFGFAASMLGRRDYARQLGSVLIGLALLFLALDQMANATRPLRSYPPFLDLMIGLENPLLGILFGTVFTAIVQSSTATTGVVLALATQNLVTLPAALAIALGAKLGSCVTAILASLGRPVEARQAAMVHLLYNCIGVMAWAVLLPQLTQMAQYMAVDLPRQFANGYTFFNVVNAVVMIWFTSSLARAAQYLVPERPSPAPVAEPVEPVVKYLDDSLLETPALALDRVRLELGHLAELVQEMLERAGPAVLRGDRDELAQTASTGSRIQQLHGATMQFTRRLAREQMSHAESRTLEDCLAVAYDLDNIGEIVHSNLMELGERRLEHRLAISDSTESMLATLHRLVSATLRQSMTAFLEHDAALARQLVDNEQEVQQFGQSALTQLRRRLFASEPTRILTFQMEVDLVAQLQRIHDMACRLARLVLPADAVTTAE